jgi:hypothetical protein
MGSSRKAFRDWGNLTFAILNNQIKTGKNVEKFYMESQKIDGVIGEQWLAFRWISDWEVYL